jgi:DNA-directed RNA polymerase specialized sigma24 family protein
VAISRNVLREILRDTYSALPALEDSVAKAIVDSRQRENSNASDIADELHRARSVLSDRQATAITLVYDEGLTYAEAAKGLGCTEKALRCRVDAARCRMLSYLRPLTQDLTAKRPSLAAPRNGRP